MRKLSSRSTVALVLVFAAVAALAATGAGASVAKKAAGVQVCGLMPDTKTSVRWQQFDQPALIKAFKAAGVSARVVNAQGDPQKQKTQADQCISDGAKVLIIAPIDSGSAAAIEKAAGRSTTTVRSRAARPRSMCRSTTRASASSRARPSPTP